MLNYMRCLRTGDIVATVLRSMDERTYDFETLPKRGPGHIREAVDGTWHRVVADDETMPDICVRLAQSPDGRLVCTGLLLTSPTEVTARGMREVRIAEIVTAAARYLSSEGPTSLRWALSSFINAGENLSDTVGETAVARTRPGPSGHPREHYERVAELYRRALVEHPRAPVKALVDQLGPGHADSTVRRWLREARLMGLLGPATPGRAGEGKG